MAEPSQADKASSFGRVVDDYERVRPNYPSDAVRWLAGDARVAIDLGAGTGKLTATLLDHAGLVVAVEPQYTMVKRLKGTVPVRAVVCARAESLPFAAGCADAVIVGQAWHWFDHDRALPELARVISSGGTLGVVWNFRDDSVEWVSELSRILGSESLEGTSVERLEDGTYFRGLTAEDWHMTQPLDRTGLLALVRSRSYVATMDEDQRSQLLATVLNLCDNHPDLAGKSTYELPYITKAFKATRN